ncbi:MAG: polysulfide reductase NrfD [Chloroflexi bacterium]|nr:polysulfide reductase NrfD [Chloroflexota bacterium]
MDPRDLVTVVYNVPHIVPLKSNIATYFFLTGVSAASFLISTLAYVFGLERFKAAGRVGAILAPIVLIIAPLFLLIDLEQPLRFIHLLYMFNFRSPVTWGTFLLILYPINCLIYLYFIYQVEGPALPIFGGGRSLAEGVMAYHDPKAEALMKFFGSLGIPLAIMVHGYTGFIVGLGQGRAMWNVSLMPMYFLVSAMVSGTALLIVVCVLKERLWGDNPLVTKYFPKVTDDVIRDLGKILAGFILLDFLFILSEVLVLTASRPDDYAAAMLLLRGSFAPLFLGVELLLGLFLPLVILVMPKLNRNMFALSAASLLVLVGIYVMRYVTVVGGQMIPLN